MFTLISLPCLFLPRPTCHLVPWYLLEFENYNIQFPAFSLNRQTIQWEQSKDSFMAIKEVLSRIQTYSLLGSQFCHLLTLEKLQYLKITLYPNSVLPKETFVPCICPSNFNTKMSWLPFLLTKFHPHLGPLDWGSEWRLGPKNKWERPIKLLWRLSTNIISKSVLCWYKPVHPFWKPIWLYILTCCWYTHNLSLCL